MSVAAWTLTATWQFARFPSTPQYCRAAPGEAVPHLRSAWSCDRREWDYGASRIRVSAKPAGTDTGRQREQHEQFFSTDHSASRTP